MSKAKLYKHLIYLNKHIYMYHVFDFKQLISNILKTFQNNFKLTFFKFIENHLAGKHGLLFGIYLIKSGIDPVVLTH